MVFPLPSAGAESTLVIVVEGFRAFSAARAASVLVGHLEHLQGCSIVGPIDLETLAIGMPIDIDGNDVCGIRILADSPLAESLDLLDSIVEALTSWMHEKQAYDVSAVVAVPYLDRQVRLRPDRFRYIAVARIAEALITDAQAAETPRRRRLLSRGVRKVRLVEETAAYIEALGKRSVNESLPLQVAISYPFAFGRQTPLLLELAGVEVRSERSGPQDPPIPVTIYLADEEGHEQTELAVEDLLAEAGFEITARDEPVIGSWFRKIKASARRAMRTPEGEELRRAALH